MNPRRWALPGRAQPRLRSGSDDPTTPEAIRLIGSRGRGLAKTPPFVFTQRPVLTVHQFIEELHKRTPHWPDEGQLEAFHRAGLLVPIYAIRADPRGSAVSYAIEPAALSNLGHGDVQRRSEEDVSDALQRLPIRPTPLTAGDVLMQ